MRILTIKELAAPASLQFAVMTTATGMVTLLAQPVEALIFRPNGFSTQGVTFEIDFMVDAELSIAGGQENVGVYEDAVKNFESLLSFSGGTPNDTAIIKFSEATDLTVTCCNTGFYRNASSESVEGSLLEYTFEFFDAEIEVFEADVSRGGDRIDAKLSFFVSEELGLVSGQDEFFDSAPPQGPVAGILTLSDFSSIFTEPAQKRIKDSIGSPNADGVFNINVDLRFNDIQDNQSVPEPSLLLPLMGCAALASSRRLKSSTSSPKI